MSKLIKNSLPEDLQDKISETVNTYAVENGFANGNDLNDSIREQLNSRDKNVRDAGATAAINTINTLSPRIFNQIVDNFGEFDMLSEQMNYDFSGIMDEGNGIEIFSNLAEAPNSTNILNESVPFVPNKFSPGYSQKWSVSYVGADKNTLTPEAYAFRQAVVYQQTSLLTQFRTGAGIEYLIALTMKLYDSLRYLQYYKWATTKFNLPTTTNINGHELKVQGQGQNAFLAWIEIFTLINKMCNLNNKYNYNGSFKRMTSLRYEDIVLYMSNKTYTTFKHNLLSQLYNNGEFKDILSRVKIYVPSYKLQWTNATNAPVTIDNNGTQIQVQPGDSTQPVIGLESIPSGFIWTTGDDEYIPDNQVFIMTKYSFKWYKQSHLSAKQFFANNFSELTNVYELGLMSYVPDAKMQVYENNDLNTDPNRP